MNPEGTYYGTPKSGTTCQATTGTPQMAVTFDVAHVAGDGGWVEINPITPIVYLYLSDGAWDFSEKKLKAMNFNGDFDNPSFQCEGVELVCKHETYNGKTREKWDIAGGEPRKADSDTIRKLSARWKTSAKPSSAPKPAGRPSSPPKATPAKQPVGAGAGTSDDIDPDSIPF